MKVGGTFFLHNRAADRHLWVILSDPTVDADRVLFVSMTSFDVTKESVCLIHRGEHPFVTHEPCIAYDIIRVTRLDQLVKLRDQGLLSASHPASDELLARIRRGANLSRRIAMETLEILIEQGLLH